MRVDTEIEKALTMWAARQPRADAAPLMLMAAETIIKLRAAVKYEKARADANDHTAELRELRAQLSAVR